MLLLLAGFGIGHSQGLDLSMSFFVTSKGLGDGANLGGLEGADAHCQALAEAAGAGDKTWRAYLSASGIDGKPPVNARDRIGPGPWVSANGQPIAYSPKDLHMDDDEIFKRFAVSELGEVINGREDSPNRHDMLTGSKPDGTAFTDGQDHSCRDWTYSGSDGSAQVGHHDRMGGGENPTSWNSAHGTRGCSQTDLQSTGGDGLFYCFAVDAPE